MNFKQLLIIALLAINVLIQPVSSQNSKCFFFNNVNTGLNDLVSVKQMDIDNKNHKWVATGSSILKFNNISWETAFAGNFNSILVDKDTTIYAVDNLGYLNVMNIFTKQVNKYLLFNNYNKVKDGAINIVKDKLGKIWITGDNFSSALRNEIFTKAQFIGLDDDQNSIFDLSSVTGYMNSTVKAFTVDNNNNKWFITYGYNPVINADTIKIDGNIYALKYDGNSWTNYKIGYRTGLYCDYNSIVADNDNNIWVGNDYTGLVKFDGISPLSFNANNSGLPSDYVNDVAVDKQNVKWVLLEGSLIAKYDDAVWTVYDNNYTNLDVEFNKILKIDKYGNKWILSKSNGIVVFNENGVNLGTNTISGTLNYDADPNLNPMPNIEVSLVNEEEVVVDRTMTDESGHYTFSEVQNGTYKVQPAMNKEWAGSDPTDAFIILKYSVRKHSFKYNLTKLAADVNNDKLINATDALIIQKRYIGLTEFFSIPDWLNNNTSVVVDGLDVVHDIMYVAAGDVNGSFSE